AASVGLLYLLLRRRTECRTAIILNLLYAFGTTTWVISSQALWMHGLAEFLIVATMLLLTGPSTSLRVMAAGLLCGLMAANRQPDTVLAAGFGLYGLWWARRLMPLFVLSGLVPVVLVVAYNILIVGNIAGAYGLLAKHGIFSGSLAGGIAGLLASPTRGLFVFSPFLLFVPIFIRRVAAERQGRGLTAAIGGAVIAQLLLYALFDWRQGISWGPRWLTDVLPMLMWMLPPVVQRLSLAGRAAFATTSLLAIGIQSIG